MWGKVHGAWVPESILLLHEHHEDMCTERGPHPYVVAVTEYNV